MKNLLNKIAIVALFGLTNAEKPAYGKECSPPLVMQKTAYGQKCKPCPPGTEYFEKECRPLCPPPLEWVKNPYTGKWECGKPKDNCIPPEVPVWDDKTGWCCRLPDWKCEPPLVPILTEKGYVCERPEHSCKPPMVPSWDPKGGWCCERPRWDCAAPLIPEWEEGKGYKCVRPPFGGCENPLEQHWDDVKGWCCLRPGYDCKSPLVPVWKEGVGYVCDKPPQPACPPPKQLKWTDNKGWCCEDPLPTCFIGDNQFLLGAKYDQNKGIFTTKDGKTYTQDQLHQPNRILDIKEYPSPPVDKNRLSIYVQEDEEGCFNVIYVECG
jgi:hypothetical protein